METANIGVYGYKSLPDEFQYKDNYLNGAFIDIGTKGKDATVYYSKEPYAFFIKVTGVYGEHLFFTVKSIKIISNTGKDFSESILNLPSTTDFKLKKETPKNYNYVEGGYVTDHIFYFSDDEIYINIVIEIVTKKTKEEKKMSFKLIKTINKGLFQFYG